MISFLLNCFPAFSFCIKLYFNSAGYLLFETIPVPRTFIGTALIIGAGFYIFFREKVTGRMIATDTPTNR